MSDCSEKPEGESKRTSGGGFAGINMADNNDIDMKLLFTIVGNNVSICSRC